MFKPTWSSVKKRRIERILRKQLYALPRLRHGGGEIRICKICAGEASVFDVVDFNKWCGTDFYVFGLAGIPVTYYRCRRCSFVFTTFFDSWSAADFSRFVYNEDYAMIDPEYAKARPTRMAAALSVLMEGCETARILDYGSGSGQFAAEMGARGFETVTSYDPFSAPARPKGKFDVITCFETIEHTVDPLGIISDMKGLLAEDGAIIISQALQPLNIDEIRCNWWYIGPRNGHVSIFAEDTFSVIADRTGLVLRLGAGMYGFSRPGLSDGLETALARLGPIAAQPVQLFAPVAEDENWNEFEIYDSNIRFRWTQSAQPIWPPRPFRPGTTKIRIPFLMEIRPGFAADCRVFAGDTPLPTEVGPNEIIARLELQESTLTRIKLFTPDPLCPHELNGSLDCRRLGLAIPMAG